MPRNSDSIISVNSETENNLSKSGVETEISILEVRGGTRFRITIKKT